MRHRNFLCVSVRLGSKSFKVPLVRISSIENKSSLLPVKFFSPRLCSSEKLKRGAPLLLELSKGKKNDDVDHNSELSVIVPVFFHAIDVGECTHRGSSGALDETSMKEL